VWNKWHASVFYTLTPSLSRGAVGWVSSQAKKGKDIIIIIIYKETMSPPYIVGIQTDEHTREI